MISRLALAVGLSALAMAPLSAESRSPRRDHRIAERLSDPAFEAQVAAMAAMMGQMVLDMKVGPLARAMGEMGDEDARDIPPDARLGDLAGPDARDMPDQLARELPRAMRHAGAAAGALEDMMPELQRMGERMRRAWERSAPHD